MVQKNELVLIEKQILSGLLFVFVRETEESIISWVLCFCFSQSGRSERIFDRVLFLFLALNKIAVFLLVAAVSFCARRG